MSNEANFHFRAQAYMVDIPADLECKNCTIRLLRQALEWSQRYLFWSCADVDIVQPGKYREECSGHGRPIAGRCRCDRLYYGNVQPLNPPNFSPFGLLLLLVNLLQGLLVTPCLETKAILEGRKQLRT